MNSLQVKTGEIKLRILDDSGEERGIFKFNPNDLETAKRLFDITNEYDTKMGEFESRADACTTDKEKFDLLYETVSYLKSLFDHCFGDGTSQILFGDSVCLEMFGDAIDGITPYYEKAREERVAKYSDKIQKKKSSNK